MSENLRHDDVVLTKHDETTSTQNKLFESQTHEYVTLKLDNVTESRCELLSHERARISWIIRSIVRLNAVYIIINRD